MPSIHRTLGLTLIGALFGLLLYVVPTTGYAIGQSKFGKIEKFPYQVMLIGKQLWRKRILCGGTLLDHRWVLTAGHCTMGVTHFDVYLGTASVDDTAQLGGLVLRTNKFIAHEHFTPESAANDIALVKLPIDVTFTSRIQPAMLPVRQRQDQFTGMSVVASGWGAMMEMSNSDPMQYTELKVISNGECAEEYDVVTSGVLCAKGLKDETVCSGDSGGPLVLKNTQVVVGITSFGPADGCETNIPGGFTRVTHYLDWIESKIGGHHQGLHQSNHQLHQTQPQPHQIHLQQPHQTQQQSPHLHHHDRDNNII
ncbi:brachyurin [Scaptodrosophila lebanonensis]|uniref:Brachyurin n=1 Tax=Drosophila lebanonensis TaxID=7225 RepID=A0A6J2UBV9_DROLE|nr:brachyurin [Scaptodrosophila lebanonensis]